MKKSRFTEEQIIAALKEHERGGTTLRIALLQNDLVPFAFSTIASEQLLVEIDIARGLVPGDGILDPVAEIGARAHAEQRNARRH